MGYLKKGRFGTLYKGLFPNLYMVLSRSRLVVPLSMIVDSTWISCLSWRAIESSAIENIAAAYFMPCFSFLRIGS